ncbi:MAG: penicillin-binding protein activator [Gammaproteobacteria bacterium]|nr:penicillin-binding protein activator [Gammaproteobacteria bacterium]
MLALSACASSGPSRAPEQVDRMTPETLIEQGRYEQAAQAWQQAALDASPERAANLRIRAADAWLLAGKPDLAESALRWIDRQELSVQDESRLDLVLAGLALENGMPGEAETLLQQARTQLPADVLNRYESLYAKVLQQLSSPGSRDLASAKNLSDQMRFYEPESSLRLVRALERVSSGELAIRAENPRSERQFAGWLDLTLTIRRNLADPEGVTNAVAAWKARHPYHLLTDQQALDTWLQYRQQFAPPRRVALLLPDSGRLSAAGAAIRDGVLSAYLDNPGGAEIQFFGTGDDQQSVISAYFNALDAGVDWIIGPLEKESVEALLGLAGLSTPVLALNQLPQNYVPPPGMTGQIMGISLSQDAEAAAVASHAARAGYKSALVIAPESPWGERMALAFESEFLQEDRQIVAAARYVESQNDHSANLERLLKIDESKARKRALENTLRMPIEFEPVLRNDADIIFLAANPGQAKLIRPQLKFLDAGDIPVYATARIYAGQPDPLQNQDLNGVRFTATPWQLEHPRQEDIPDLHSIRRGSLSSLYALGQDAWNLLTWLELMQKDPDFRYFGQSGTYWSAGGLDFQREPAWAEFSRGRPAALLETEKPAHP